tara:strand:- start:10232 stop:11152 length:921 start_codon:yes stop_codon:yes gene_type:complete
MLGLKTFAETPISSLINLNDVNVAPTGQVGTGAVGSPSFSLELNFLVSQDTEEVAAATTALGTPIIVIPKSFSISGQAGTSALGSSTLSASALVDDYGNNPDEPLSALTGSISGIGVNGSVIAILPNLAGTVGSVSVTIDAEANVSIPLADEGESELGTPVITADSINAVAGQAGTSALGIVVIPVTIGGLSATSALGTAVAKADANVSVSGFGMTTGFGTVTQRTSNTIVPTGYGMTGSVGTFTFVGLANVAIDGVSATIQVGEVRVYDQIDDSQTPNYSNVDDAQTPNYSNINRSQTPDWQDVA